jgi:hypothetical protein
VTRLRRLVPRRIAAFAAVALCAPATALGQGTGPVMIDGDPLNTWTTPRGSLQFNVDGYLQSEFFPPSGPPDADGNPTPSPLANSGFGLVIENPQTTGSQYFSNFGGQPLPNPFGPRLDTDNPSRLTTDWTFQGPQGNDLLRVTQILSYTEGERQVDATLRVANVSGVAVNFRATVGGDLAVRGDDSGVGFDDAGPPRFIGATNPLVGAAGGFVQDTPWSHFQVGNFGTVASNLGGTGVDDTIDRTSHDAGIGVQWDTFQSPNAPLAPGATAEFKIGMRFVETLGLDPTRATRQTGQEAVVHAKVAAVDGTPASRRPLTWLVTGANTASGQVNTDSKGDAKIGWIGGSPGDDTLTVFRDSDEDGTPDTTETQATATITWEGPDAPVPGETVNIFEESGTVKIQLPKRTSPARAKAFGLPPEAANKFVPLSSARSIPVGSILDTRRGTVRLLSAGRPVKNNSGFNGGSFRGVRFQIRQRGNKPLTTLTVKDRLNCSTGVPRGGAPKTTAGGTVTAARRRRSLFGRGRGRFRTRGRNSSATVRGTRWIQKDTCTRTITRVKAGTVVVRDFSKRRKVTLKAKGKGRKRYVARLPRRLR